MMSKPIRTCPQCNRVYHYADWLDLPLVARELPFNLGGKQRDATERRECTCGRMLHVWCLDVVRSESSLTSLTSTLCAGEAPPLSWVTEWTGDGDEDPLSRAWRFVQDPDDIIQFLMWWDISAAWLACASLHAWSGLNADYAITSEGPSDGEWVFTPSGWWGDIAYRIDRNQERYLAERLRTEVDPPRLTDVLAELERRRVSQRSR